MQRRIFLKNTAAISAITILKPGIVFGSKANSAIRVGIIGCGNRGTAVISSMSVNGKANIIAMADLFDYQLQSAKPRFDQLNTANGFPAISKSNIYQGSKAYLELINNKDVDAVLISSPAYTHPAFTEAAVAAGKHVYCEKPVAVDTEGCKRMEKIGESLNGKLSLAIGFQIRYGTPYVEMVKRVQRGDIGEVVNAQLYYLSSVNELKPYKNISDDEARIRNHFHFRGLSGGILLDQGIHMLDVCNWTLNARPLNAIGRGSNKNGTEFGDAWNNYQVIYQYPNDVNVSFHSTQYGKQFGDVCARFIGTKGIAEAHYSGGVFINGENKWDSGILKTEAQLTPQQQAAGIFLSALHDADANKHKTFINSIETGNFVNEARQGAESTLTAILGRAAADAKQEKTWDEVRSSNEKINPQLNLAQFDKK